MPVSGILHAINDNNPRYWQVPIVA